MKLVAVRLSSRATELLLKNDIRLCVIDGIDDAFQIVVMTVASLKALWMVKEMLPLIIPPTDTDLWRWTHSSFVDVEFA